MAGGATGDALVDRIAKVIIRNPAKGDNDFRDGDVIDVLEINSGVDRESGRVGLRVEFDIEKADKKEPNQSKITIYNLSGSTRSSLQQKGVKLSLEAGYRDTGLFRIFAGDVRTVDHVREKAMWGTVMQLGDGERAWQFAQVNESFSPGTSKATVLRTIAEKMGLDLGNTAKQAAELQGNYEQGYCVMGNSARELDRVLRALRLTWSIQDGQLQILKPGQTLDLPIPVISPQTGLVGSPEMGSPPAKNKPQLVQFKALLLPTKPGAKVKLESERYDGYVRVKSCKFTGDTSGGEWYTHIAGVIVQ